MDFTGIFGSMNLTDPSWDLFVLVTFLVGIYFYLFKYGKDGFRTNFRLRCAYCRYLQHTDNRHTP